MMTVLVPQAAPARGRIPSFALGGKRRKRRKDLEFSFTIDYDWRIRPKFPEQKPVFIRPKNNEPIQILLKSYVLCGGFSGCLVRVSAIRQLRRHALERADYYMGKVHINSIRYHHPRGSGAHKGITRRAV